MTRVDTRNPRAIILLLATSVAVMMTGYGLVMPVFAKRLGEIGGGVGALGLMTMAFALGQFLLAPVMGKLADRRGRKPLVILALAAVAAANLAYLVTASIPTFVAVRFLQGALAAGLLPAAMGIVADLSAEHERGRRLGLIMGAYSFGFVFGPVMGGILYDGLGYTAPFGVSAGLAITALLLVLGLIPETGQRSGDGEGAAAAPTSQGNPLLERPGTVGVLLVLDFIAVFPFAFVEPQMIFHFYDALGFSSTQFGLIIGTYGLVMVAGQAGLGSLSDRLGRRIVIAVGFACNISLYLGLATLDSYAALLLLAAAAGVGTALVSPALSAAYLDVTGPGERGRIMGLKESAAALGAMTGPLLVAFVAQVASPGVIFLAAAAFPVLAVLMSLLLLPNDRTSAAGESTGRFAVTGTD